MKKIKKPDTAGPPKLAGKVKTELKQNKAAKKPYTAAEEKPAMKKRD